MFKFFVSLLVYRQWASIGNVSSYRYNYNVEQQQNQLIFYMRLKSKNN